MNKNKIFACGLLALTIVLAVVSFMVLPERVITQFSAGGSGVTTMPRILAVLIPTVIGIGGAIASLFNMSDDNSKGKSLLVSAVSIIVFVIMLVVNH